MKQNKTYLAAFTLTEILVALLLMSMVFLIGWQAYRSTDQLFSSFTEKNSKVLEQRSVVERLRRDIDAAQLIYRKGNRIYFEVDENSLLSYESSKTSLLRTLGDQENKFEGIELIGESSDRKSSLRSKKLVDRFILNKKDGTLLMERAKKYGKVDLKLERDQSR